MGVLERREREKQELRQQILDTARELFRAEGYQAVTMRRIAGAIEHSPTAIYLYFRDKNELVNEMCSADFRALAQEFLKIAEIHDPLERLRKALLSYVEFGLRYPNHYRLKFMILRPQHSPEREAAKGNPEEDAYAFLKHVVETASGPGCSARSFPTWMPYPRCFGRGSTAWCPSRWRREAKVGWIGGPCASSLP